MTTDAVLDRQDVRRTLLAVCVLDEIDVLPADDAIVLAGTALGPPVRLDWSAAVAVLGGHPASSAAARLRLASWLRLHRAVADLGPEAAGALGPAVRALALPPDAALHPGSTWVRGHVLGCALQVGLGVVGLTPAGDGAVPLWPDVAAAAGLPLAASWARARTHLEAMGSIAARRLQRQLDAPAAPGRPAAVSLAPVGGCDVLTLLASCALRTALASSDGVGLRAVAVPDRTRGWIEGAPIDPAFVAAAWSVTEPARRGLACPVLVTADEVVLPPARAA